MLVAVAIVVEQHPAFCAERLYTIAVKVKNYGRGGTIG